MGEEAPVAIWLPRVNRAEGPLYLAIAEALAADIASGRLVPGTRLPPHRVLAEALAIDFTTVTRAYAEARRRGLVEGRVGQGTYVRPTIPPGRSQTPAPMIAGPINLSMNLPPRFEDPALVARLWQGIAGLETEDGLGLLLRYQAAGGGERDRAAGAAWLAPRFGRDLAGGLADRVVLCAGGQGALLAVTGLLVEPGETLAAESLTFPGLRALAQHQRLRLVGVPIDRDGLVPEAFERICREARPKALYCNPTLQNPTTATLPLGRRQALVAIARHHGVPIIEDDAYGPLAAPIPPLSTLAPDLVYHIAGLSKSVAPALRIAYLVAPDQRAAARLTAAVRATVSMASPLTAAIACRWIEDGTAAAAVAAIAAETRARQAIAAELLPAPLLRADPAAFHLWLALPQPWTRGDFVARLQSVGIGVVGSDAFAVGAAPEAVRIGLGAPPTRAALTEALNRVADLIAQPPALASMVV